MGYKLTREVWTNDDPNLREGLLTVMLCLADMADNTTRECWPSHTTLASRCRLDRRNIARHLSVLEHMGYISRHKRPGRATLYHIRRQTSGAYATSDAEETSGAYATSEAPTSGACATGLVAHAPHEPSRTVRESEPSVDSSLLEKWKRIAEDFQLQLTPDTYELNIHHLTPVAENGAFTVQAHNRFAHQWLTNRFQRVADRIVQGYGYTGLEVLPPEIP